MWNRKELKEKGKASVKRNYWKSVFVSAIFASVIGGAGFCGSSSTNSMQEISDGALNAPWMLAVAAIILILVAAVIIFEFVLILNPFSVGVCKFRLNALRDKGNVSDMGAGFDVSYKKNVKILLLRDVYMVLWTLLLIVPGIVKVYEYRMIPYLLADNPNMSKQEAFSMSKAMMKGNKWRAFVLDLSFILWDFLGVITFGIVQVFWVDPYKQQTDAALYEALKTK